MKINVEVNLDDFYDLLDGEKIDAILADEIKMEIMKLVKKDQKYKAYINKKAKDVLDGLDI